ncbi:hypothetical protein PAMP_007590 [Pampus punctatissimus]
MSSFLGKDLDEGVQLQRGNSHMSHYVTVIDVSTNQQERWNPHDCSITALVNMDYDQVGPLGYCYEASLHLCSLFYPKIAYTHSAAEQ